MKDVMVVKRASFDASSESSLRKRKCNILTLTWNVGNKEPNESELEHWLPLMGGEYDLVVVGTQENKYKEKGNRKSVSAREEADSDSEEEEEMGSFKGRSGAGGGEAAATIAPSDTSMGKWEAMIMRRLGAEWGLCKLVTLVEMRLAVFAREASLSGHGSIIRSVQSARSATGLGSVYGNKGGLVIALTYGQMSFCFVSCHLAAHSHRLAARNADLQEILSETRKTIGNSKLDVASEFDHVFWMGDLNYRLDPYITDASQIELEEPSAVVSAEAARSVSRRSGGRKSVSLGLPGTSEEVRAGEKKETAESKALVRKLVEEEQWGKLLEMDQLKDAKARGEAFAGFDEGEIGWAPTFKVRREPGTQYKDQRVPSYCDRVLWKSMPPVKDCLVQTSYTSVPQVSTSDHKPVLASFAVRAPSNKLALTSQHDGHGFRLSIRKLNLSNILAADLAGTSDPYCLFLTNPPGLLDGTPRTSVKPRVPGVGSTGGAVYTERFRRSTAGSGSKQSTCTWEQHELPLLSLNVGTLEAVKRVTLIVALYDRDRTSQDDPIGVVWLPLMPQTDGNSVVLGSSAPAGSPAAALDPGPVSERPETRLASGVGATAPESYSLRLNEPIMFGHTMACGGRLRCEINVAQYDPARIAKRGLLQRQVTAIEDSAIIAKVRRDEAAKKWFIIDPRHSKLIKVWDGTTSLALIFTALVTPWEVAFLPLPPVALFAINRIVDVLFCLDVVMNFLLMYQEGNLAEGRRWIYDPMKIANRYLRGWFTVDVASIAASAFDIQTFVLAQEAAINSDFESTTNELFLLRIVRVLRLIKLLRLVRGSRLLKRWQTRVSFSSSTIRAAQLVGAIILSVHWISCVLALQTAFSSPLDTWYGRFGHCWVASDDPSGLDGLPSGYNTTLPSWAPPSSAASFTSEAIYCSSPAVIWLQSLYWSLCLLTGIHALPARGSYVPYHSAAAESLSDAEMTVLFFLIIIGALIWAYVVASFVDIITNFDPDNRAFRNALDSLNRFLQLHNLHKENPRACQQIRDYFHHTMHIHRTRSQSTLYSLMSPTMQATFVSQIPFHTIWIRNLESQLNAGRAGLFLSGDKIRIEAAQDGRNLITHVPSGMQVERQDFNGPLRSAVELTLELTKTDERVGAAIKVSLTGLASYVAGPDQPSVVEFFNVECVHWRRSLNIVDGHFSSSSKPPIVSSPRGLASRPSDTSNLWAVQGGGRLFITEPKLFSSLPPVEAQFLVQLATRLQPMIFAPSELMNIGRLYIVHRGLALLRKRWLGVGALWGMEMVLAEHYTQQYAAHAVTHCEVFWLDRHTMLQTASHFENAAKRLRRYCILRSLKSYLLGNYYSIRAGGRSIVGKPFDQGSPGALDETSERQFAEPSVSEKFSAPRPVTVPSDLEDVTGGGEGLGTFETGHAASTVPMTPSQLLLRHHVSPRQQTSSSAQLSADVHGLKQAVRSLQDEMAVVRSGMTELLRRIPPPTGERQATHGAEMHF